MSSITAAKPITISHLQGPYISSGQGSGSVAKTSGTSLKRLIKPVANPFFEADPISLLKLHEPKLFRDRRILIVDDLSFALERARNIVEKNFKSEYGCQIETVNDPELVINMLKRAVAEKKPYDVLITDLYMQRTVEAGVQGINGDELLRRLTNQGLFLPTVVFSGSWASDIGQNLFTELDSMRSREAIHHFVNRVSDSINGIPLIQVNKTGSDVERALTLSLCGVLLMGKRSDIHSVQQFLSVYKPKTLEDTPSREVISKALEINRIYREYLLEVKRECAEKKLTKNYSYSLINQFLSKEDGWHLNNIGDASSDKARVFFHNTIPVMQWIYEHSTFENKLSSQTLDKLEEFYRAMNFYAISTKKSNLRDFQFNSLMRNLLKGFPPKNLEVQNSIADQIELSGNPYIIQEIIIQPITNAMKAVRGKLDGSVKVFAREITNDDLTLKIDGKRFIEIIIEDNGCGIPPEKVNEINERKCKEGGSTFGTLGWGLPILQDFMIQAGGAYQVESIMGQGTKFKLYFKVE